MNDTPAIARLRQLDQENEALKLRLARHELRQMERELCAPVPFKLNVKGGGARPDTISIPEVEDIGLAPLPVPMGSIVAQTVPADLPVIGVYDDGLRGTNLASALLGLLSTQYSAPFARLLFLCSSFEAVPFLGRYGFATEQVALEGLTQAMPRLTRRYGVHQIRSLGSGTVLVEA